MIKEKRRKTIGRICALVVVGILMAMTPMSVSAVPNPDNWSKQGDDPGPTDFLGTTTNEDLIIKTNSAEVMRITGGGRVGIGDTSPDFKLEVDGSSGSGYFGVTSSSNGDLFQIDSNGDAIFNDGGADNDFRIEGDNDANLFFADASTDRIGIGTNTPDAKLDVELSSGGAAEIGHSANSATGDYAVAIGASAKASGYSSMAIGYGTEATNTYSFAQGITSSASGQSSFAVINANASGIGSAAIGWFAKASGGVSYAMGSLVQATEDYSMVLGRGDSASGDLINDIESSLMIGFHSTTPTFFVNASWVGIGTTAPFRKLDVLDAPNPQLRLSSALSYFTDFQTTGSGYLNIDPSHDRVGIETTDPKTTLDINGGLATHIRTETGAYTATAADHTILIDATGGAVTVTLPAATSARGQILVIKKIDGGGNNVAVTPAIFETIDGASPHNLGNQWDSITIQSNGSNWYILH